MLYDVFISHASEDKKGFVRSLAEHLRKNHLEVWYDDFSLKAGDSLRRSIDLGLSQSRYGIVVLSKNFFRKKWPQWELDGLVQRQMNEKRNLIIPIWHNISVKEVTAVSPSLADKVAIKSNKGLDQVVLQLLQVIKPERSTLLIARDILLRYDYKPPVVTDDWWLDVIEFSASNPVEGTFQEASGWGRWGFPLPPKGKTPLSRGKRLAGAAMQMLWENKAKILKITQITHPDKVLEFIKSTPGLGEMCHKYISYLMCYAPQLTIRGFGGEFEREIEKWYHCSSSKHEKERQTNSIHGTALTVNKLIPLCDQPLALRHPTFGDYKSGFTACYYIQGDDPASTMPEMQAYEIIDYIVWFLSDQSNWMPKNIHKYLLQGFKEWAVWLWSDRVQSDYDFGFKSDLSSGSLQNIMYHAKSYNTFKLTKQCLKDMETRFNYTINLFNLNESANILVRCFIKEGFIEDWFKRRRPKAKTKIKK